MQKPAAEKNRSKLGTSEKESTCHDQVGDLSSYPDHQATLTRLRKVRGQIEGIERMILERRYCTDILIQFKAVHSALKSVEAPIFEEHLRHCVSKAAGSNQKSELDKKIKELVDLFIKN